MRRPAPGGSRLRPLRHRQAEYRGPGPALERRGKRRQREKREDRGRRCAYVQLLADGVVRAMIALARRRGHLSGLSNTRGKTAPFGRGSHARLHGYGGALRGATKGRAVFAKYPTVFRAVGAKPEAF